MARRTKSYLDFILSEANRIDEKGGFIDAALKRAGSRVKNNAISMLGGNSSFVNKAHGELETMDIAGKLRSAWFKHAGRLNGTDGAKPTPNNIKKWMKQEFNADVDVSGATISDDEVDAENEQDPNVETSDEPDEEENDETNSSTDATAAAEQEPDREQAQQSTAPQPEPEVQQANNISADVKKLSDYIVGGMGIKGMKPKASVTASAGRNPEAQRAYLLRILQAYGSDETTNPIDGGKLYPKNNPVGKAMANTTIALSNNDSEAVYSAISALKTAEQTADPAGKEVIDNYFGGVKEDTAAMAKFPKLKDTIEATTAAEPFSKTFLRLGGAYNKAKTAKNNITPQMSNDLVNALQTTVMSYKEQTPQDRAKIDDFMGGLESDTDLIRKVPKLRNLMSTYSEQKNNVSEQFNRAYLSSIFESAGYVMEADGGDEVLNRVQIDAVFKNITQQLFASGAISFDGENSGGGGGGGGGASSSNKTNDASEGDTRIDLKTVSNVAGKLNTKVSSSIVRRMEQYALAGDKQGLVKTAGKELTDEQATAIGTAAALQYRRVISDLSRYSAHDLSSKIYDISRHMRLGITEGQARAVARAVDVANPTKIAQSFQPAKKLCMVFVIIVCSMR